jgi:hypothetical protein
MKIHQKLPASIITIAVSKWILQHMEVAYNEATPSSHPFLDGICHSYSLIIHHPAIGDPP